MGVLSNLLTKLIGSQRLSDLHRANASKYAKGQMVAEFLDDKGRWYYSFRDESDVPITRLSEAHSHMQYMAAGLSAESFKSAMDTMTELFAKSQFIQAGVVLNDMNDLNRKIVNLDAMVNIIAVYYVREDEDVVSVNASIHAEKCDFLKSETDEGRFFFRLPRFIKLLSGQTLSKEDAASLYRSFQAQTENLSRRWSILRSGLPTPESTAKD
jgi:hypothetical protein